MSVHDVQFLKETMQWPMWPFLTLKNYDKRRLGWPLLGFIMDTEVEEYQYCVFILNIFGVTKETLTDNLRNCEKFKYNSYEELMQDGWEVD